MTVRRSDASPEAQDSLAGCGRPYRRGRGGGLPNNRRAPWRRIGSRRLAPDSGASHTRDTVDSLNTRLICPVPDGDPCGIHTHAVAVSYTSSSGPPRRNRNAHATSVAHIDTGVVTTSDAHADDDSDHHPGGPAH